MSFAEKAALRRKSKDLKNELKDLKKNLLSAGCEKGRVTQYLNEFEDALEMGNSLQVQYNDAGEHLRLARETIGKLLECMGESPAAEVDASLQMLAAELDLVYHDCSIRKDDLDFLSTVESLKQMIAVRKQQTAGGTGMSDIMLRSELENIKAVLDDAAGWSAPDFLALAYYFLHEDKDALGEMENEQRNTYIFSYFREHFMGAFETECNKAGLTQKVHELAQAYVYGE